MPETAVSVFRERVQRHPERVALRTLAAGGAAREEALTWSAWYEAARRMAAALIEAGHQPGERVAILAGNRPLWPIADLGVLMAGGVGVGIYPTSAPGQVRQLLGDSAAVAVVADTAEQLAKVLEIRTELPALRTIVCQSGEGAEVTGWEEWLEQGARALAAGGEAKVERRVRALRPEDDAVLIYTSGSTGEPKGARISHQYLLASARSIQGVLGLTDEDTALSFLPFCHAAERVFGLYTRIACGMEAGMVEDYTRLWEAARAYGPTLFGGLPRSFEKVCEALQAEQAAARGAERERWERVLELGRQRSHLRRSGAPVPAALEREWSTAGEPLFARVRERFGGRLRMATSGGAALPTEVAEYLDALGFPVLGAFGLSEHLCVAFNRPDHYAFDAAGPPMPGTTLKIADDGEILVRRGPLTFSGYHAREEETRKAFTPDGEWLRTGDLGEVGDDGLLRVTGRKKELIALSNGKKIAPVPIEGRLVRDPWIGQAMLYGEGRKFVSALLSLRPSAVEGWARERNIAMEYRDLLRHPALLGEVQCALDRVNAGLSRPERVRRYVLLERDLSVEEDELTPTLKIRRPVVAERYRAQLDALYR
jgi:long-chain acyl-CoA synthetase